MKTKQLITILAATFAATWLATAADDDTNAPVPVETLAQTAPDTNAPAANEAPAQAAPAGNPSPDQAPPPEQPAPGAATPGLPVVTPVGSDTTLATNGVMMDFQNVPLTTVLNYLSAKAGLIIISDYGVNLQGTVSVIAKQPVSTNEIVSLLNDQLSKNNYGAYLQGRTLTIMGTEKLKTWAGTPVEVASNYNSIPMDAEIVTEILPLRTLPAGQLVKDLDLLIPRDDLVTPNEAGNAIIMTAPRKDIRRIDQIVNDLDGTAFSEVEVSILKFADSKAVAGELKEIFESADSDITRASSRNTARSQFGGGGGRGGFGAMMGAMMGGGGGGEDSSKNVSTHAVFVSDDQMNAVISSAPPDYMRLITNVILKLDQPNQEVTMIRVFRLKHADPGEVADEISALFPTTGGTDQNSRTMGMRFMGGMGGFMGGGGNNSQSQRMKLQTTVMIQPDRRTQSVIITASRDMMDQLEAVIKGLDEGEAGIQQVRVFSIGGADPATVQTAFSTLFYSPNKPPTTSTTTTSALTSRATANQNSQSSTSSTTTSSGIGGGSSGLH